MAYGWMGKILRVDLTNMIVKEELTESYTGKFLGGKGINTKLLWDEVGPETKPMDADNRLIFGAGPLVGTIVPAANKCSVVTKSPQSGISGNSILGGYWAAELKFAGYDHLIIQGQSENPAYLWINDGSVEIRGADHLWGKETIETETMIRDELKGQNIQVACIGPAGENKVVSAAITHGLGNSASRTGMGAVMGSKNLKAIAINGSRDVNIAKPSELGELCNKIMTSPPPELAKKIRGSGPGMEGGLGIPGPRFYGNLDETPVPEFVNYEIKKAELFQKYLLRDVTCFNCPIPCKALLRVPDSDEAIAMKCENVCDWIVRLKICEPEISAKAMLICHKCGLDTFSTTAQIAFLMDLYEKGIITEKDTDGIPMKWGNSEAVYTMIEKIGRKEGCGELFAQGIVKAAEIIGRGADKYAYHIKGIEPAMYSIYIPVLAAATALSERADITRTIPAPGLREFIDPQAVDNELAVEEKAFSMEQHEKAYCNIPDLLGVCRMPGGWLPHSLGSYFKIDEMVQFVSLVTGNDIDRELLDTYSERMNSLVRAFDLREGITKKDDTIPEKFFVEPSPVRGKPVDRTVFNEILEEFYSLKGWNSDGIPTRDTLEKLGLDDVANDLEERQIIQK